MYKKPNYSNSEMMLYIWTPYLVLMKFDLSLKCQNYSLKEYFIGTKNIYVPELFNVN